MTSDIAGTSGGPEEQTSGQPDAESDIGAGFAAVKDRLLVAIAAMESGTPLPDPDLSPEALVAVERSIDSAWHRVRAFVSSPLENFMPELATVMQLLHRYDLAEKWARRSLEINGFETSSDDPDEVVNLVNAIRVLVRSLSSQGRPIESLRVLDALLGEIDRRNALLVAMMVRFAAASACLMIKAYRLVAGYFEPALERLQHLPMEPGQKRLVDQFVKPTAREALTAFYYELEDYPLAMRAGQAAAAIFGYDQAIYFVTANAGMVTRDYASSLPYFLEIHERGKATAGILVSLISNLAALTRYDQATEFADELIKTASADPRGFLMRAKLLAIQGKASAAFASYRKAIDVAAAYRGDDEPPARLVGGNMRVAGQKVAPACMLESARLLAERRHFKMACRVLQQIFQTPHSEFYQSAANFLVAIAASEPTRPDALQLLNSVLQVLPDFIPARRARAELLVELGDDETLLVDLEQLSKLRAHPATAVRLATRMIDKRPSDGRWRNVRGLALLRLLYPKHAADDLQKALDDNTDNVDILIGYGLAMIMASLVGPIGPDLVSRDEDDWYGEGPWNDHSWIAEESTWCDSLDFPRIARGISTFIRAFASARSPDDASRAKLGYLWILDHVLVHPAFQDPWITPPALWQHHLIVPELGPAFDALTRCLVAQGKRDWRTALHGCEEAIRLFADCGLVVAARALRLRAGDLRLRLYDLQAAVDDILIGRVPLTAQRPRISELLGNHRIEAPTTVDGAEVVLFELEFFRVQALGAGQAMRGGAPLLAQAYARIGDYAQAIKELGDVDEIEQALRAKHADVAPVLLGIAQVFRDADRAEDALKILDRLNERDFLVDEFKVRAASTRATCLHVLGRIDEAEAFYREAWRLAGTAGLSEEITSRLQRAGLAIARRDWHEGLASLDIAAELEAKASRDARIEYWRARRICSARIGAAADALAAAEKVLELVEEARQELVSIDARISWLARYESDCSEAVVVALMVGDVRRAFEFTEQARSRTLLDEAAALAVPVSAASRDLVTILERLRLRRRAVRLMVAAGNDRSKVDPEVVALYERTRDPDRRSDAESPGVDDLAKQLDDTTKSIERIEKQLVEARLRAPVPVSDLLQSYENIRARIWGEQPGNVHDGSSPIIVSIVIQEESTLVFFVTGDAETPYAEDVDIAAEAWLAAAAGWKSEGTVDALQRIGGPLATLLLLRTRPEQQICIVPDPHIDGLPLHALLIDGAGQLIDRNPVSYAPSASVLAICVARRRVRPRAAIVIGDPLGDLPFARLEMSSVSTALDAPMLVGADANLERVKLSLGQHNAPNLVHFACHGNFDEMSPAASGLVLASARPEIVVSEVLTPADIAEISLDCDLVTLGACFSGRNVVRPGAEFFGMTRAILLAGARSVLVACRGVDDVAAWLVFVDFYERLVDDGNAATPALTLRRSITRLRDLTAREAVLLFEGHARGDAETGISRLFWVCALVRAAVAANDFARAGDLLEGAEQAAQQEFGAESEFARSISAFKRMNRLRAQAGEPIDYEQRPFGEPRFWAPFALIGDWSEMASGTSGPP